MAQFDPDQVQLPSFVKTMAESAARHAVSAAAAALATHGFMLTATQQARLDELAIAGVLGVVAFVASWASHRRAQKRLKTALVSPPVTLPR